MVRPNFSSVFGFGTPVLALAPMQDVTDLPFMRLLARYGAPDLYFTEYFRVTAGNVGLQREALRSVTENDTGVPVCAQLIGNDPDQMVRWAQRLLEYPVAGIDLNLGCPAPVVYRKCAGGGLLRDPERVDRLLGTLRAGIDGPFSVKTRVGFSEREEFEALLDVFSRHAIDLLSVHGRTVADRYGSVVQAGLIREAANRLDCPVLANGSVDDGRSGLELLRLTGARGLMVGRGAIRNPWVFRQIREALAGREPFQPSRRDVLVYIDDLYRSVCTPDATDRQQVQKMKKYLNFIGAGVSAEFLYEIRRVVTKAEFFETCERYLDDSEPIDLHVGDRYECRVGELHAQAPATVAGLG